MNAVQLQRLWLDNVTREHCLAATEAYMRSIERRIEAGLNPEVGSVVSLFVSRGDMAVADSWNAPIVCIAEKCGAPGGGDQGVA